MTWPDSKLLSAFIVFSEGIGQREPRISKVTSASIFLNIDEEMDMGSVPVKIYEGSAVELGSACGKPFSISYITVVDEGKSDLLR